MGIHHWKTIFKNLILYPGMERVSSKPITPTWDLKKLGSDYGGWIVPVSLLKPGSICYCIGAGEDITFDVELMNRFHCEIFSYDPTPRAVKHVAVETAGAKAYHFFPIGVWDQNETLKFYAPADPAHVSHSVLNLQRTEAYFEANCKRLASLFEENRHASALLLKLDVEGADISS